jgi:hypothetical protein
MRTHAISPFGEKKREKAKEKLRFGQSMKIPIV